MDAIPSRDQSSKGLIIAAFAAIYIIWGSTYTAVLIAIRDIPPLFMGGLRFTIAGGLLLAFARLKGEPLPPLTSLKKISVAGALMLFIGTGSVAWVEQYIPSGLAAIVVAAVPIWFVVLDRRNWSQNFTNRWTIIGLLIGFAGVITLFADKRSLDFGGDTRKIMSVFILMAGSVCWAAGSLYSKYATVQGSSVMKAAIQMVAAGICSIALGFVTGEHRNFQFADISTPALLALAYLIFIGSLVGYISYVWLLSVRSAALVGTYAYVNPIVAVFLGWLVADEHISGQQGIALLVILSGVVLVTISKRKEPH